MQVIDQINGSALFAQSAYSAYNATKDNLGRDITATYLTAHQDISNLMPKSESANFYPMEGNPSGFLITHQAISADEWNSNYETVNTNSGVWGGSALPVSAGPGIKVNLVDNTLLFSNDETVLYAGTQTSSVTLSEPITNFEAIKIYHNAYCDEFAGLPVPSEFRFWHMYGNSAQASFKCAMVQAFVTDSTHIKIDHTKTLGFGFTATGFTAAVTNNDQYAKNIITQVIGVNRINGGN